MTPMRWLLAVSLTTLLALGCSDPCAYVAPPAPMPDPTPCDAGTVISTCALDRYCVTDAGPLTCAPRKSGGAPCSMSYECSSDICQPNGTCGDRTGC